MKTPPVGPWHGYFEYAGDVRRYATQLAIEIEGSALRGAGLDEDGAYAISGHWERTSAEMRWQKSYEAGGVTVAYVGTWDGAEVTGRWRIVNSSTHGRFALKPGEVRLDEPDPEHSRHDLWNRLTLHWQRFCKLDLEAVRFDGETQMLSRLLQDDGFVAALKKTRKNNAVKDLRYLERATVATSMVRLSRALVPRVFQALDRCLEALGLSAPVELMSENDPELNASVNLMSDGIVRVTLTSGLINTLDAGGLAYIIGHELGHGLLGHLQTRVFDTEELSGLTSLQQLALQRYQEISADRIGLLCCPDLATALRVEFLMRSGITTPDAATSTDEMIRNAHDAVRRAEQAKAGDLMATDTHPYVPMRTVAIEWFARSTTYHQLRGQTGGELPEAELESLTTRLVSLMNPPIVGEGEGRHDFAEFVALGALAVAEVTDGVSREEAAAVRKLDRDFGRAFAQVRKLPLEQQQVRLVELAETLVLTRPFAERQGIIELLTVVAQVDGEISPAEQGVLMSISDLLQVGPLALDQTLSALNLGLD